MCASFSFAFCTLHHEKLLCTMQVLGSTRMKYVPWLTYIWPIAKIKLYFAKTDPIAFAIGGKQKGRHLTLLMLPMSTQPPLRWLPSRGVKGCRLEGLGNALGMS